jgi:hypothetical protein
VSDVKKCGNGLHEMTEANSNNFGQCRACRATARRRRYLPAAERRLTGDKLCEQVHPNTPRVVNQAGRCRRCRQLGVYRGIAERSGAGLCENDHGLVYGGVSPSGECTECTAAPQPAAATWLDWAAVYQALQGRPLVRALTNNEMLCALTTLRRRNGWERTEACDWMRVNTQISVPDDNLEWVELVWARRHGLPALTVNEAITHGYEDYAEAELELDVAA